MASSFSFKTIWTLPLAGKSEQQRPQMSAFGLLKSYQRSKLGAIVLGPTAGTNSQSGLVCGKRKNPGVQ
jgi:hypothetical protein